MLYPKLLLHGFFGWDFFVFPLISKLSISDLTFHIFLHCLGDVG